MRIPSRKRSAESASLEHQGFRSRGILSETGAKEHGHEPDAQEGANGKPDHKGSLSKALFSEFSAARFVVYGFRDRISSLSEAPEADTWRIFLNSGKMSF